MKSGWLVVLLLSVAFSGCASDDGGDSDPASAGASEGTNSVDDHHDSDGSHSSDSNSSADLPPTANLTADYVSGAAPLQVNFTLNGTAANMLWSFDANGDGMEDANGTTLPFNYTHSFLEAGAFLANLTVSNGTGFATAQLTINVTGEDAGPTFFGIPEEWFLKQPGCGARSMDKTGPSALGCTYVDSATFGAAGPTWNFPATVESNGFYAGTTASMQWRMGFVGPYTGTVTLSLLADGKVLGSGTSTMGPGAGTGSSVTASASFPIGDDIAEGAKLTMRVKIDTYGHFSLGGGGIQIG